MYFEYKLPEIMESINQSFSNKSIEEQNNFIPKIMKLLMVWNDWVIFDTKYLFGLESLLNRRNTPKKLEKSSEYNNSTPLGIKLKCIEEDLKMQTINTLEKNCKLNGLPNNGSKEQLIERLITLEEYKLKMENTKNELKNDIFPNKTTPNNETYEKNNNNQDVKIQTKNCLGLLKTFRNINIAKLNDRSTGEISNCYKIFIDVLKLLQSRSEKFNVTDFDGMEFDEIDEYLFDTKKKVLSFEENIDG